MADGHVNGVGRAELVERKHVVHIFHQKLFQLPVSWFVSGGKQYRRIFTCASKGVFTLRAGLAIYSFGIVSNTFYFIITAKENR